MCIMLYPVGTMLYGGYRQAALRRKWDQQVAQKPTIAIKGSNGEQSSKSDKEEEFPPTRIIIPKINIDQIVQEGISKDVLTAGPGHYPDTVNPGDNGYCAIAGHRVTYSRPFNRLDELEKGDTIILEISQKKFIYKVFDIELVPSNSEFDLDAKDESRLALTTCAPKYSDTQRLIVRAAKVSGSKP